jgi:hypothetical protein
MSIILKVNNIDLNIPLEALQISFDTKRDVTL